jgi:hypothetical protein
LDKGPGQLLRLPWRGGFAGFQADGDVLDPHRLPRLQGQVANDAVALVEQAQDRHPLGHRSHARLVGRRARDLDGQRLIAGLFGFFAAGHDGQQNQQRGARPIHAYSGFHAS